MTHLHCTLCKEHIATVVGKYAIDFEPTYSSIHHTMNGQIFCEFCMKKLEAADQPPEE